MGALTTTLLQKYGAEWRHALAIDDLYFAFMAPALAAAGLSGNGSPEAGLAGAGSEAAFQRIRKNQYQTIAVAEPLNLQGWQLVDEQNRAISGQPCSGYVTSSALLAAEGLKASGDGNLFDSASLYREVHAKICGE